MSTFNEAYFHSGIPGGKVDTIRVYIPRRLANKAKTIFKNEKKEKEKTKVKNKKDEKLLTASNKPLRGPMKAQQGRFSERGGATVLRAWTPRSGVKTLDFLSIE